MATSQKIKGIGSAADDDLDLSAEELEGSSMYDSLKKQMREELKKDAEVEPLTLTVPLRRRQSIVFMPEIDFEQYEAWIKRCTKKERGEEKLNFLMMAMIVLSTTCVGIEYQKKQQYEENGEPMTFASHELHDMLGVPIGGTAKAIRKMYKSDGHVIQTMHRVLEAAGYSLTGDVTTADNDPLDL